MAQDPELPSEPQETSDVDPSHDLDMVTIYDSTTVDAEMEADIIHGVLQANGIPSILVRASQYPPLGFEIKVPRAMVEDAERVIAEAEAAGPEAAVEAEAAGEASTEPRP
jgi:hypothetical protein